MGENSFCRSGSKRLVVAVDTASQLTLSQPQLLFERRYAFGTAQTSRVHNL